MTRKKNALILLAVVTLNEDKFLKWNNYLPDFRSIYTLRTIWISHQCD